MAYFMRGFLRFVIDSALHTQNSAKNNTDKYLVENYFDC
jgi:hypothetical protein